MSSLIYWKCLHVITNVKLNGTIIFSVPKILGVPKMKTLLVSEIIPNRPSVPVLLLFQWVYSLADLSNQGTNGLLSPIDGEKIVAWSTCNRRNVPLVSFPTLATKQRILRQGAFIVVESTID
jgi:hypothetical protein